MRQILLAILLGVVLCSSCSSSQGTTPRQQLLNRLSAINEQGVMYGHQDDPFYGISWQWETGRSDTKELVGDYPAVMGFDLGGIELGDEANLDSVPFSLMRSEICNHYRRGGIITISWHPRNPLLGTTAWVERDTLEYNSNGGLDPKTTVRSVLRGGEKEEFFHLWLERVGDFLCSLKDDKGEPIPIIFRPWHEGNGSWFWWGKNLCSAEESIALWTLTQDYILSRLPESIVWAYSPNLQGNYTEEEWLERYPGDERVDIIGEDAYQWGTEEAFVADLHADLKLISAIAQERGKLVALTECGFQNSPDATWWTRVFRPIIEQYDVLYFLPWRNWHAEHFGASRDAATADDFARWAEDEHLLFLNDIKDIH